MNGDWPSYTNYLRYSYDSQEATGGKKLEIANWRLEIVNCT